MDYDIFKFGVLNLDGKIQPVPQSLTDGDYIPQYDGKAAISFGASVSEEGITWIKPNGGNLLVSDCVLLASVSWEDLNENGFVAGKTVLFNGQHFRCRLLQVGEKEDVPNEWDKILDKTNIDDAFWHWKDAGFWGADISAYGTERALRVYRGYYSARFCDNLISASYRDVRLGFRPALEPLSPDNPTPNINLDGVDFQLNSLPGGKNFCPILNPIQGDVFKDISAGDKVRMYTFTEDGHPIHMDEPVKDPSKLTLTDRYYGDEFLVPWVISNGIAVASQSLSRQSKN